MAFAERPSYDELLERVEALEQAKLGIRDLPLRALQDRLEQDWRPNAGVLLGEGVITPEMLAEPVPWRYIGTSGEPAFQNAWVNFGQINARFYKDANGIVRLGGLIKSGTIGTAAFTLPAGYRPSGTMRFATPSNTAFGQTDVQSGGGVLPSVGSNVWVDLSGIQFRAEA